MTIVSATYRTEIDGLRAIAVVSVIFFHAGIYGFSGGYIGVDIFFVISGFLITGIIKKEFDNNQFSFMRFYERRARRILPALFFVVICCSPFAWLWMVQSEFKEFSKSVIAAGAFISNFFFWQKSDYFEATAEEKPLLHIWSLAVEEQFYVIFPIFFIALLRLKKRDVPNILLYVSVISLILCEILSRYATSANFYLMPTRAWELLIGSLCVYARQDFDLFARNMLSSIGLILIVLPIFTYDEHIVFPSLYALAPTVGTGLILLFAKADTIIGRSLSLKPLVGIGLVSYSAYLWH